MSNAIDRKMGLVSESLVRRISRRRVLSKGLRGAVATAAGLAVGQGFGLRGAEAFCAPCDWAMGVNCSNTRPCPAAGGCPSGCRRCVSGSPTYGCSGWCPFSYGQWVNCNGLGYGYGYTVCTDCDCNYRSSGAPADCGNLCTCLSQCINCGVSLQDGGSC